MGRMPSAIRGRIPRAWCSGRRSPRRAARATRRSSTSTRRLDSRRAAREGQPKGARLLDLVTRHMPSRTPRTRGASRFSISAGAATSPRSRPIATPITARSARWASLASRPAPTATRRTRSIGRRRARAPQWAPRIACTRAKKCHPGGVCELLPLRPAREHPRQGAEPPVVGDGPLHEDPPRRRLRVLRDSHGPGFPRSVKARRRATRTAEPFRRTGRRMMAQDAPGPAGPDLESGGSTGTTARSTSSSWRASSGSALTGVPLLFSGEALGGEPLVACSAGSSRRRRSTRVFATGMLVCFGSHLARPREEALRGQVGARQILWGPSSLVLQPRDLAVSACSTGAGSSSGRKAKRSELRSASRTGRNSTTGPCSGGMGTYRRLRTRSLGPEIRGAVPLPGDLFNVAPPHSRRGSASRDRFHLHDPFLQRATCAPASSRWTSSSSQSVIPLEELKHERPAEYDQLVAEGGVERITSPAPTARSRPVRAGSSGRSRFRSAFSSLPLHSSLS